jgi:drug/metabolite transporter (DMT)-like permease
MGGRLNKSGTFTRGYLIALVATILWSFTGVLISYLSVNYQLPSLVLAFWRDLFVAAGMALALLLLSRARFRLARRHWPFMVIYGLTLSLFNSMWTFSVQYNGAAVATVLAFARRRSRGPSSAAWSSRSASVRSRLFRSR